MDLRQRLDEDGASRDGAIEQWVGQPFPDRDERAHFIAQLADSNRQQILVQDKSDLRIECPGINCSEQFLTWIKEGENEKVQSVVENLSPCRLVDKSCNTLLHYAAEHDNQTIVTYLIKKGFNVNAQNSTGTTPLMLAVKQKREEVMDILLTAEADILILNEEKKSALDMFCAEYEWTRAVHVKFLGELRKNCFSNEEAAEKLMNAGGYLYHASGLKDDEVLAYVENQEYPVNSMHPKDKEVSLSIAIAFRDVERVKLLLKHGANAKLENVNNNNGTTALHALYAYELKDIQKINKIFRILLNHVSPTSCTTDGYFQVEFALIKGDRETIRILLEANADFTAKDFYHKTVLHYLARNMNPGVAEELKLHSKKFDLNAVDAFGTNSMYYAIRYFNVDMLAFLLSAGAEVNIDVHFQPLFLTYDRSSLFMSRGSLDDKIDQCAQLLLQHHADPQFVTIGSNGEEITIFDVTPKMSFHTLKPVVAHLAFLDSLGTPITEIIRDKINSQRPRKKYFNRCRRLLKQKVSGTVTLFKLFTADKKKMAKYWKNKELVFRLERLSFNQKLRLSYSYYYNTIKKRYLEGVHYTRLKGKAVEIICGIFGGTLDMESLIVEKIIDYLNDRSLESLCEL